MHRVECVNIYFYVLSMSVLCIILSRAHYVCALRARIVNLSLCNARDTGSQYYRVGIAFFLHAKRYDIVVAAWVSVNVNLSTSFQHSSRNCVIHTGYMHEIKVLNWCLIANKLASKIAIWIHFIEPTDFPLVIGHRSSESKKKRQQKPDSLWSKYAHHNGEVLSGEVSSILFLFVHYTCFDNVCLRVLHHSFQNFEVLCRHKVQPIP